MDWRKEMINCGKTKICNSNPIRFLLNIEKYFGSLDNHAAGRGCDYFYSCSFISNLWKVIYRKHCVRPDFTAAKSDSDPKPVFLLKIYYSAVICIGAFRENDHGMEYFIV